MTTVFDVPADLLIEKVAEEFKQNDNVESPAWSNFVRTGVHKERKPENADWWFIRAASIIRRVYIDGPVGVESLRTFYGGKKTVVYALKYSEKVVDLLSEPHSTNLKTQDM